MKQLFAVLALAALTACAAPTGTVDSAKAGRPQATIPVSGGYD